MFYPSPELIKFKLKFKTVNIIFLKRKETVHKNKVILFEKSGSRTFSLIDLIETSQSNVSTHINVGYSKLTLQKLMLKSHLISLLLKLILKEYQKKEKLLQVI